jgi:large subunit ribosomal protein L47
VLKHTGLRPRQTLSVKTKKDFELPRPVAIEAKVHGDEDHGLWGFFPEDKKLLRTPAEESQHGSGTRLPCTTFNG